MVEIIGIGHVVLKVRDLKRSKAFYMDDLGFKYSGSREGMVFLRCSGSHHDIALLEVGTAALTPSDHHLGLFHVAFKVPSYLHLKEAYKTLKEKGVTIIGAVDHVVSKSFYIADPDGSVVELYSDSTEGDWRSRTNPFIKDYPLSLEE
ncbi:MAG: VOC family protein [Nitrospirota bacterium]